MDKNADFILETERLKKTYLMGKVKVTALNDATLKVVRGEFIAIMGPSGSGKSTLLNLLGLLDRPTSGSLFIEGKDTSQLRDDEKAEFRLRTLGFVFQFFNLIPELTALENVMFPMMLAKRKEDLKRRAGDILRDVGLAERLHDHLPTELSGGEQQRVAIARSLANNPAIIFLDEPTGNLDVASSLEISGLLRRINEERLQTILMVTHEQHVSRVARKIVHLEDGSIRKIEALR
jgi:putative ABC transport system ATP-binding protein